MTNGYLTNLTRQLDELPPGAIIDLSVIADADAREKYISGVKMYIDNDHPEIEFNSNYTKVRKINSF